MRLKNIVIHNYRSALDCSISVQPYSLLVGANNAGKSTIVNAVRAFYDDLKYSREQDFPKVSTGDTDSWVQLTFSLTDDENENLPDKYKQTSKELTVRKYLQSDNKELCRTAQSNIYAIVNGVMEEELFFGAKNISQAKLGEVVYIPAISNPADNLKTSGPSPLRDTINFVFKKQLETNEQFQTILRSITEFDIEANKDKGLFQSMLAPINEQIADWKIQIGLQVSQMSPDDVTKNLIKHHLLDEGLAGEKLGIDQIGHGFQRTLIFSLIRIAATLKEPKATKAKEFKPNFTLLLFEEPEAYLHPSQQEQMFNNLKKLALIEGSQVLITSHSSHFVSKSSADLTQIIRVCKSGSITETFQIGGVQLESLMKDGSGLLKCLQDFVNNANIPESSKKKARALIAAPPNEEIGVQEERFRYQLWLNSERSKMFFADHVVIVEGPSEKALFDYLLDSDWTDLLEHRPYILEAMGKFNFHRCMSLMEGFGIKHSVFLDSDDGKDHQGAVNDLIETRKSRFTCDTIYKFDKDLESQLSLPMPRNDKKPIEILKALEDKTIGEDKLSDLKSELEKRLAVKISKVPVPAASADITANVSTA